MFMQDGRTEQPAHWVLNAHAETEGEVRLPVTLERSTTTALASRDDRRRRLRLLVGRHGGSARADVLLQLEEWPWPGPVVAEIARIPTHEGFGGNPSLAWPLPEGSEPRASQRLEPDAEAGFELRLRGVAEGEAWLVDLRPATRLWLPWARAAISPPGAPASAR